MGKTLIAYYSRRGENYVNGSIKEGCSLIRTFLWSATQNCIGSIGMPLKGIA